MDMEIPQQQAGAGAGAHGQDESGSLPLSPASAAAAALWNPTEEQVAVLEGLYYEHGLRSPSAEQIQQIADRLREHGHGAIEGKSVFYWFQNHSRARLRHQRQRQDCFAYFTRLLRRPPPLPVLSMPPAPPCRHGRVLSPPAIAMPLPPPAACNNNGGVRVMYMNPFYMTAPQPPPANAAYNYPHQPQQQVTVMYQQYPRMEVSQDNMMPPDATFQQVAAPHGAASTAPLQVLHFPPPANGARGPAERVGPSRDRETLQLFPLQPTFAQLRRDKGDAAAGTGSSASLTSSTSTAMASAAISEKAVNLELESAKSSGGEAPALPFYDFFGLQSARGR